MFDEKHLLIYHSGGSFFAEVLMKIILLLTPLICAKRLHATFCLAARK